MNNVKEQYVSIDVAKLLARFPETEKSLDWNRHYWGYKTGEEFLSTSLYNRDYDYPAPTHQVVFRWLREVMGIMAWIEFDGVKPNGQPIYRLRIMSIETGKPMWEGEEWQDMEVRSVEQGEDTLLKYILTKLIEERKN